MQAGSDVGAQVPAEQGAVSKRLDHLSQEGLAEIALAHAGSGSIDAGVVAHGSLLNEGDVEAIKKPVLFLYSANDQMIPDETREKFQGILKGKSFPTGGVYYPDQASRSPQS